METEDRDADKSVYLLISGQSQMIHKLRIRYQTLDVLFT